MEFSATIQIFEEHLWSYHAAIPDEIYEKLKNKTKNKRVKCTVNKSLTFQCGMMPSGRGYHFIMFNKERRSKLGLNVGDELFIHLEPDDSIYGIDMPEEMEAVLFSDPNASDFFHKLTPGKQRSLIYIVSKVKNPDIKIHKSIVISNHLKNRNGKLDFKVLNQDFKDHPFNPNIPLI